MLKFILIPVIGLVLTLGTFFYEDTNDIYGSIEQTSGSINANSEVTTNFAENNLYDRVGSLTELGFPFSFVNADTLATVEGASNDSRIESLEGFLPAGFFANWAVWSIIAAIGYFVFKKIRDLVGTIVLVGIGVVAGLMYFGILVV